MIKSVLVLLVLLSLCSARSSRYLFVGNLRISLLSPYIFRLENGSTQDQPSITFPSRLALPIPSYTVLSEDPLIVEVYGDSENGPRKTLLIQLNPGKSSPFSLDCEHMNATIFYENGQTEVACFGEAQGRPAVDPTYPGILMDQWSDIIRGPDNLNGSLDTLDCYVGSAGCYPVLQTRVQLGLLSRAGWSLVDDTNTSLWDESPKWRWQVPRRNAPGYFDWYIMAPGRQFRAVLAQFVALAGRVPLKPWRTYGVWQSREFPYTEQLVQEEVAAFHEHSLPLNMFVLDYGWHYGPYDPSQVAGCHQPEVAGGQCTGGYGGYQWNLGYFPSPTQFQAWAHHHNLSLCLNIHDQCGIDSCQQNYVEIAEKFGINPSSKEPVVCHFMEKEFAMLHATLVLGNEENRHVDYWWNDYGLGGPQIGGYALGCWDDSANQTFSTGPPSYPHCMRCYNDSQALKPQLWNAYVRVSWKELQQERGFVLGIYGGLGHHRYPGVGSGDTFESFDTLAFEISLTISASNLALEWNHDLGGFMPGPDSIVVNQTTGEWMHNPEIYLRWLQAGVFQPIFRTHMCEGGDPNVWLYPNFALLRQAYQRRNALVPYLYTASYLAYLSGGNLTNLAAPGCLKFPDFRVFPQFLPRLHLHSVLPVHPLYYDWPTHEPAYTLSVLQGGGHPLQHMFGDDLTVAPITAFVSNSSGTVSWSIWVPPGQWAVWDTGALYTGPKMLVREWTLEETPTLARAGSVIPMKTLADQHSVVPGNLLLTLPWTNSRSPSQPSLYYEDEGEGFAYQFAGYYLHQMQFTADSAGTATLKVQPCVEGAGFAGLPFNRTYTAQFRGAPPTLLPSGCLGCQSAMVTAWQQDGRLPVLEVSVEMPYCSPFQLELTFA